MHSSSLLPYERFPSAPKKTKRGRFFACSQSSQARFVCLQTSLSSMLPAGLLSGRDRNISFIFGSLVLQSYALSHSAFTLPVPACHWVSLAFSRSISFCSSLGSKRHHCRKENNKGPFLSVSLHLF